MLSFAEWTESKYGGKQAQTSKVDTGFADWVQNSYIPSKTAQATSAAQPPSIAVSPAFKTTPSMSVADIQAQIDEWDKQRKEAATYLNQRYYYRPYNAETTDPEYAAMQSKHKAADEQIKQLQTELEKQKRVEWEQGRDAKIAQFEQSAEKATPSIDAKSLAKQSPYQDVAYALDDTLRQKETENVLSSGGVVVPHSYLDYLNDNEKAVLQSYAAKGDWQSAKGYLDSLKTVLTARESGAVKEATSEASRQNPLFGAVANVASSFATPFSFLGTAAGAVKEAATGEYTPVDTNANIFRGSQITEATTEGIHQNIKDKLGDGTKGKIATFLADTALSIGQFLSKVPFGATGALAYMASGAAGQTAYDVSERGGSAAKATLVGAASGLIEAATEKIPLDNLLKVANSGGVKGVKATLSAIAKQAGIEATEEAISEVANNVVDIAVMGGLSEFNQYIEHLKQTKGLTQQQAEAEALTQFFVVNTATAAAGGAISGGVMGGGATILSNLNARAQQITADAPVSAHKAAGATETQTAGTSMVEPEMRQNASESVTSGDTIPQGMGAASANFSPYSKLQNEQGTFEAKENPSRVADVPLKDAQGRNVSGTVQTVMEAQATPDAMIPTIEQAVVDGLLSYDVYTDKAALSKAESTIQSKGFQQAYNDWTKDVTKGKVNKTNTALGWTLYNNAANVVNNPNATAEQKAEATKTAISILVELQAHQRAGAQALQAQRLLKKMSPEYQLYALQKAALNISEQLTEKYGKEYNITIPPELAQEFLEVVGKDTKAQAEVEKKIRKHIAEQVPATFLDKWNAWRYLAMLGNPRTHIRNIVGTLGFMPVRMMKNVVAATIEKGAQSVGLINERSKSILTLSKKDRARMSLGWADYANVVDEVQSGGKYTDVKSEIEKERTIFSAKWLEASRKGSSTLLDLEDTWFSRPAYAESFASYLKANNITAEQYSNLSEAEKTKIQAYAIKEAQKATYRDHNVFSDWVARLGKNYQGDNPVAKAANVILEGVLPFKRTPANIFTRIFEYSPIGLIKTLTYDTYKLAKGEISATEFIDNLSAGFVGTALVGLGMYLRHAGLIAGGGGRDKKQDEFDKLQGKQRYAIALGNKTFTLDWLAPEAIPVFMGVELYDLMSDKSEGGLTLENALKAASELTDPMLEMSMLQGVQDVIEGVKYSDSPLTAILVNAATGYLTQAVPTLFGQIERTVSEDTRQSTYVEKGSGVPSSVQLLLGKTMNKLPGEYNQIDYIDAWGRTQGTGTILNRAISNFLSPAYSSTINTTEVDKELQRLYDTGAEGTSNIFPQRPDKTVTIDGTKINLSAEDYVEYAKTRGQTAFNTIEALIKTREYASLTDSEKAAVINRAYTYANHVAKSKLFPDEYKGDKWLDLATQSKSKLGVGLSDYLILCEKYGASALVADNVQEAYKSGIDAKTYLQFRYDTLPKYDANKNKSYTQDEVANALRSMKGLTDDERAALWQVFNSNWKSNPFAQ